MATRRLSEDELKKALHLPRELLSDPEALIVNQEVKDFVLKKEVEGWRLHSMRVKFAFFFKPFFSHFEILEILIVCRVGFFFLLFLFFCVGSETNNKTSWESNTSGIGKSSWFTHARMALPRC